MIIPDDTIHVADYQQHEALLIGSAKDGSLRHFIPGTRPEGLAGDEMGNIFAGLTGGCDASPSGGCLQKWVKR